MTAHRFPDDPRRDPPHWPTRTHTGVHVVRWRRPHWTTDRHGCYRWHTRWFVIPGAAQRFAANLRAAGCIVHRDLYRAEFVCRIDENRRDVFGPDDLEDDR